MHICDDSLGRPAMCAESRCDFLRLSLHMHVPVYDVPFQQKAQKKKHSLRAACHQKVLSRNSHKCILHTFAGNNTKKKLNLTMSEDFSLCEKKTAAAKADDIRVGRRGMNVRGAGRNAWNKSE